MDDSIESIATLFEAHGPEVPLDRAMLLIAEGNHPDIEFDYYLSELDWLAEEVNKYIPRVGTVGALRKALFGVAGFRGDSKDYHNPKNTLFNEVLDRRMGIPISLSVVYLEVARRLEIDVEGVGFPGHFIVRHESEDYDEEVLIDPFSGGLRVEREDCARILSRLTGHDTPIEEWMFAASSNQSILARVLSNLHRAFVLAHKPIDAINVLERLMIVDPERFDAFRDRGLLYMEIGCHPAAVKDIEFYLEHEPEAYDNSELRRLVTRLRRKQLIYN